MNIDSKSHEKIREKDVYPVTFDDSTPAGGASSGALWTNFMVDLDRFRAVLIERPSVEAALGAADHVGSAMESGLFRPGMIVAMTAEARQFFAQAEELVPAGNHAVTARWARHEILTRHPEAALLMLDGALAHACEGTARQELIALQEEAWFASSPT